ncbi:hypothetical protein NKH57_08830 [Mesorhizobium sp. M1050]|uniref:hypothetical protein n=1 Tax=unclassified Mesorhizobium TaxID=325217 RepID=UPI0003CF42F3|nr:hypothetical protein [Mesorhizobium sp. LNHC252B00]ESY75048.1 hypothetical protein X743_05295 [Mesorhizobium sp. LNHC252B00]
MSKTTLVLAILAISISYADAKGHKVNLPVCTASSSLAEVLGDKCFLVKGSKIYGDIADLSQIVIWAGGGAGGL